MPESPFERFRQSILPRHSSRETGALLSEIGQVKLAQHGCEIELDRTRDQLVFLAAGSTKLVVRLPDASEQVLAFHFSGDIIHVPHFASTEHHLVALDDCTAIAFPTPDFLDMAEGEPAILRAILVRTLMALQRSRNKAIRLGRKSAQERIADFLLAMAERIGVPDGTDIRLNLPMSRRDIGESLGLTIETVSRQFSELREDNLIATAGRSLVWLHDRHELAVRAGHVAADQSGGQICAGSKNSSQPALIASASSGGIKP